WNQFVLRIQRAPPLCLQIGRELRPAVLAIRTRNTREHSYPLELPHADGSIRAAQTHFERFTVFDRSHRDEISLDVHQIVARLRRCGERIAAEDFQPVALSLKSGCCVQLKSVSSDIQGARSKVEIDLSSGQPRVRDAETVARRADRPDD